MNSYAQSVEEDRRLTLLKLLQNSDGYECNHYLLLAGLKTYGHNISTSRLKTDLHWLEEQGLVENRQVGDVLIARIRVRGVEVSDGRVVVPGVKRPSAGH